MSAANDRIADMSRTVYAWSCARTSSTADAEELSQEVLLAMLQAVPKLKDESAFYAFMWSVAQHVYGSWLRKRRLRPEALEDFETNATPLDVPAAIEADEMLRLLRREMTLLGRRQRQATVLYYIRGMKVAEIAETMQTSVSMVKYLLFKARNTIREGMDMERRYGEQSYHPRRLSLRYWGRGPNHYYQAADTLLRQNILFACYNDMLTASQIALAVGVGLPYMEDDLAALHEADLLAVDSKGRYRTNIIVFTEDFIREAAALVMPQCRAIADAVSVCISTQEEAIRALGFSGCDMDSAAFSWQMAAFLLHRAVVEIAGEQACPELTMDKWGVPCLCWAVEESQGQSNDFTFGTSRMGNARGDFVHCFDLPLAGPMVHHALSGRGMANVFLRIASGEADDLSENDEAITADLVRRGYVTRIGDRLAVRCPVFRAGQYSALLQLLEPTMQEIAALALTIRDREAELLCEHVPVHCRNQASGISYFRLFDVAVSTPLRLLCAEHFLPDIRLPGLLPTTYVVLA